MSTITIEAMERAARKYCELMGMDPETHWRKVAAMLREQLAINRALREHIG